MPPFTQRPITLDTVAVVDDPDELWRAFLDAHHTRDLVLADAIRARLAALQRSRTASDLDDDQLVAQIITLRDETSRADHGPDVTVDATPGHASWERRSPSEQAPPGGADPLAVEDLAALVEEAQRRGLNV